MNDIDRRLHVIDDSIEDVERMLHEVFAQMHALGTLLRADADKN